MTKKNENPEAEGPQDEGGFAPAAMLSLLSSSNSKPDTAQGVAEVLDRVAEFTEEHRRTKLGELSMPGGEAVPVALSPHGTLEIIDPEKFTPYTKAPMFRRGKATMTSLDSLIAHINRFGDEDSAVFVNDDASEPSITAVLDYHRKDSLISTEEAEELGAEGSTLHGEYRHGLHRTKFRFPVSDEWKAWHRRDGETMSMADFASFLEERVLEVAEVDKVPESAERFVTMLGGAKNIADWSKLTALAKSLKVHENAVVSEAVNLSSGALGLTINEEHETEVGGVKAEVPTMFFIDIPIFRDGVVYRLPVRLRWRKGRGSISFFYEMWGADRAFRDALKDAVNRVDEETSAQVFYGSPE